MDQKMLIDLVILLILAAGVVIGAVRGLFKSLMMLVLVLVALIAAGKLSGLAAGPVTDRIYPVIAEKAESVLPEQLSSAEEKEEPDGFLSSQLGQAADTARSSVSSAAYDLTYGTVRVILFLLLFILLRLLLQLAVKALDKVFDLPVLRTLNCVGGGLFGLVESALLLFLAAYLARELHVKGIETAGEGTVLASFFLNNTPLSLLSAIV